VILVTKRAARESKLSIISISSDVYTLCLDAVLNGNYFSFYSPKPLQNFRKIFTIYQYVFDMIFH